jgi:hypothetical protein
MSFVVVASVVIVSGLLAPHGSGGAPSAPAGTGGSPLVAVLLAFPVAMALATGVEAPSSAVAQLGQLERAGKVRFGQVTLWLTLCIVGWLTIGLTVIAVRQHVGIPPADSTQIAGIARAAVGDGALFAAFQATSAVLLLAAASSSFQAGPGLLKALAGSPVQAGILPRALGRSNVHHTPYWSVVVFLGVASAVITAGGGREQELVLFYAVAVFVSFMFGLLSMSAFSRREGRRLLLAVNVVSLAAVLLTLVVNLRRGYPIASLGAAMMVAASLYVLWARAGRPGGVSAAELRAEEDLGASA